MARDKLKPLITSFTSEGDFLAILSSNGTVKIWNTSNGSLLAEWKQLDGGPVHYSCMACAFVGKKRKKENGTFLLALGTKDGDIFAIDVFTGDTKWNSSGCHPGGVAGLSFTNKGRSLHSVGADRMAYEINSVSGERIKELKASKKSISSLAFSCDKKILAVSSSKMRLLSLETGKELLKFPDNLGLVQHISVSDDAKTLVTLGVGEKHLQVWRCDLSGKTVSEGPVLAMQHLPSRFECKNTCEEKDNGLVVLAISESGVVYVWNMKTISQDEVNPSVISFKGNETEEVEQKGKSAKKSCNSVFAATIHAVEDDKQLSALIAYGPIDSPRFSLIDISSPGNKILVNAIDGSVTIQENGILAEKDLHDSEVTVATTQKKKSKKKRPASDMDLATMSNVVDSDHGEAKDGVLVEDDMNEPTMGEKLASLNLQDNNKMEGDVIKEWYPHEKPPKADSVDILLKQALHADDRTLLLTCLYTQDEKVIAKSISLLNPSDVLKLLHFLISIIQSRGAILACALPWLRSLLLQHASGIMSHESSLLALNTIYQLVESRVSTFQSALQLSSCMDFMYAGVVGDVEEETDKITPIIYEDKDESDEESEEAMDTDHDSKQEEASSDESEGFIGTEGSDGMMSE